MATPFSESDDWILKIISGPHQGAEVVVHPGRLSIGAHAECDLVLHDVLVAPQHLAFTLERSVVTAEPLEGRVYLNGKRLAAAAPVPDFAFVTVGTTHLVLGPASARWPLLSPADVPDLEKEAPTAPTAAENDPAAAGTATSSDPKSPKPPTPLQRRRALWVAGFGGVLLLIWIVLWFMWAPPTPRAPHPAARERAEQVLRSFPTAKQVRLEEEAGRLTVTGYLDSDAAHREITTAFREDAPEVTIRLWSTPRLAETAQTLLAESHFALELTAAGPGELRVRGSLRSRDEWTHLRQMLLAEVPGLVRLQDEITFADPSGANPLPLFASFSSAPIVTSTAAAPSPVAVVALQALDDGQGWLRLSDGRVLFRGATLAEGGRLAAFTDGQAFVEQAGERRALTVGAQISLPKTGEKSPEIARAR